MEAKPEKTLFPFGAATQAEVIHSIRSQCVDEDVRNLESIVSDWRAAAKHYLEIVRTEVGVAETIDVKDIDEINRPTLDSISSDFLFKQAFSLHQIEFKLVEIGKLVAAQRFVNLDFVEELKERLPKNPEVQDLIEFCLAPRQKQPAPKVIQLGPNAFAYSSLSSDFRFLGGYQKPLSEEDIKSALGGGLPVASIVLLVGYGSSTCNVFSVGKRMILNNGFHRIYSLGDMGIKYAPVVVQRISNVELELPPAIAGLPKEYLVGNPRPVLMKDLFDPKLVKIFHKKPRMTNVQVVWQDQKSFVPI